MSLESDETRETRLELRTIAWTVLLIDLIAIGVFLLIAPYVAPQARWIGVVIAAWITVAFVVLVTANLVAVAGYRWYSRWRDSRGRR